MEHNPRKWLADAGSVGFSSARNDFVNGVSDCNLSFWCLCFWGLLGWQFWLGYGFSLIDILTFFLHKQTPFRFIMLHVLLSAYPSTSPDILFCLF